MAILFTASKKIFVHEISMKKNWGKKILVINPSPSFKINFYPHPILKVYQVSILCRNNCHQYRHHCSDVLMCDVLTLNKQATGFEKDNLSPRRSLWEKKWLPYLSQKFPHLEHDTRFYCLPVHLPSLRKLWHRGGITPHLGPQSCRIKSERHVRN